MGHSTRLLDTFIALLQSHGVQRLVDVRTVPRSRHNPQFNRDTLPTALASHAIGYEHDADLGGLRHTHAGHSTPDGVTSRSAGTPTTCRPPGSRRALARLMTTARRERIVLMCAEAVPWRCHRSLIGDALLVHGLRVEDILSGTRTQVHKLTPFARVNGLIVTYPPEAPPLPS